VRSDLYNALMASPAMPEIIEQAQRAYAREQELRQKFYDGITPEKKWEFIQGEVIRESPALDRHLQATQRLFRLFDLRVAKRRCGKVRAERAMTVFPRNDYEPDIVYFGPSKAPLIGPDTLKYPIPDLIVEVLSPSTEARDRGVKFEDYASHGVGEYWIIDTVAETVELYRLAGQSYPAVDRQADGVLRSDVVPGFEVPVRAVFDDGVNLEALGVLLGGC
jgi:Uma2 family endonuclease